MQDDTSKKEVIAEFLVKYLKKKKIEITKKDIIQKIETPPSPELGDFALPCFFLSSRLKEDPSEIALEIREDMSEMKGFKGIETKGSYVNFFVDRKQLTTDLISEILSKKDNFGKLKKEKADTVMIEFSQTNTHKAFHVGHIRGTSIGESLSRIFEFCGDKVVRANYQGDTGMHVAKWIWCYKKYHAKEKLQNDESWIASIYVDAVKRLEKNEKLQPEVDEVNRKLESREDEDLNNLWKETRELSLKAFEKIYSQLNTHFDVLYFEKEMEERGKEIVKSMLNDKIAKIDQEATIVDLRKYDLGIWVLIRRDGTILYAAKDLALVEKKFQDYKLNKSINVVGDEQNLHFRQLIKTLELTDFKFVKRCQHVPFATIRLPEGKMSSRTGNNVLYSDFLQEVMARAKKEIKKREPKIDKKILEDRALKISIAAIKYYILKQNEQKILIFDINESLNFEGNSGAYIQYSYARAGSIMKKTNKKPISKIDKLEEKEIELIKKLEEFPDIVLKSCMNLSPSYIANYAYQLAQTFNEFYHQCPVIKSKREDFRISLVQSFRQVLKNSLSLLGIDILEEM